METFKLYIFHMIYKVYLGSKNPFKQILLKSTDKFCLFNFLLYLSNFQMRCCTLGLKAWINSPKFFSCYIQVLLTIGQEPSVLNTLSKIYSWFPANFNHQKFTCNVNHYLLSSWLLFLFPLISNVSVSNSSIPSSLLCVSGFTGLHVVIPDISHQFSLSIRWDSYILLWRLFHSLFTSAIQNQWMTCITEQELRSSFIEPNSRSAVKMLVRYVGWDSFNLQNLSCISISPPFIQA